MVYVYSIFTRGISEGWILLKFFIFFCGSSSNFYCRESQSKILVLTKIKKLCFKKVVGTRRIRHISYIARRFCHKEHCKLTLSWVNQLFEENLCNRLGFVKFVLSFTLNNSIEGNLYRVQPSKRYANVLLKCRK